MEASSGNIGGGLQASLGGRYALALFELAEQGKSIAAVEASLAAVRDAIDQSADFRELTSSPLVARGAAVKAVLATADQLGVDPTLLGGLVVRIGSQMIDPSIRTRLNALAGAMKG